MALRSQPAAIVLLSLFFSSSSGSTGARVVVLRT
jgi:hypothetical protein